MFHRNRRPSTYFQGDKVEYFLLSSQYSVKSQLTQCHLKCLTHLLFALWFTKYNQCRNCRFKGFGTPCGLEFHCPPKTIYRIGMKLRQILNFTHLSVSYIIHFKHPMQFQWVSLLVCWKNISGIPTSSQRISSWENNGCELNQNYMFIFSTTVTD